MKLYTMSRAPNPRRVAMFIAEKGIEGVESVQVNIMVNEHKSEAFRALNPLARVPALQLDDGRVLCETRAICTWLEGFAPEPNLMGEGFEERAFIEMADRRVELNLFLGIANAVRHTNPAMGVLEQPQYPEFGATQAIKMRETVKWLDETLARQEFVAGARFTIADITAFCALEFGRGLLKFRPGDEGFAHVQAWRDRIAARPSAAAQ
ncbi:glutathione S-transferase family protein [Oxalobacteraceae bacterium]|nr:glutathione S-transferase family protein [Oxalobacteraceae bacterium]